MRTIKFRGKRIDNKEWVYGYLYELPLPSGDACMILTQDNNHLDNHLEPKYDLAFTIWVDLFLVDPATVGQFTGFDNCFGSEIYEGDILLYCNDYSKHVVVYHNGSFGINVGERFIPLSQLYLGIDSCYRVVGNIHDNAPERLKGGEQ